MDIPVYLIAGFLDSGKTSFINGILQDGFAAEDRTLLLCCEEGETAYDPKVLGNVFTYTIDEPEQLTPEKRLQVIAALESGGLFLLKGAVKSAAASLQCSPASVYRYITQIKNSDNGQI